MAIDSVENLSLKELKQLESRLEQGISKIKARKVRIYVLSYPVQPCMFTQIN